MMFILATLTISSTAFAISNEDLANKCLEVGKAKIISQAEAYGCDVDSEQIDVQDVDNRWYSPSKYVWYEVKGECNELSGIVKMVQYSNGKCF